VSEGKKGGKDKLVDKKKLELQTKNKNRSNKEWELTRD
jgi:hypothetical protein